MIKNSLIIVAIGFLCLTSSCRGQVPATLPAIEDAQFANRLERLLDFSIPVIGVQELADKKAQYLILDTREKEEFLVSHITGAAFAGYKNFDWNTLDNIPLDQPIVVYCSVGYRSEKIGEQIKAKGYTQVYNLYGSIFEWANQDFPLEDAQGKPTKQIHTYNGRWSKWVEDGSLEKVW